MRLYLQHPHIVYGLSVLYVPSIGTGLKGIAQGFIPSALIMPFSTLERRYSYILLTWLTVANRCFCELVSILLSVHSAHFLVNTNCITISSN